MTPSEKGMKKMLGSLLPGLRRQMAGAGPVTHREAEDECGEASGWEQKLGEAAARFAVEAEAWWRSQDGRFRHGWTFGVGGEAAEFLAALLLHLWLMDGEGCFEAEEGVDGRRHGELWQAWLDEYPGERGAEEEQRDGQEGCVQGRGEARCL